MSAWHGFCQDAGKFGWLVTISAKVNIWIGRKIMSVSILYIVESLANCWIHYILSRILQIRRFLPKEHCICKKVLQTQSLKQLLQFNYWQFSNILSVDETWFPNIEYVFQKLKTKREKLKTKCGKLKTMYALSCGMKEWTISKKILITYSFQVIDSCTHVDADGQKYNLSILPRIYTKRVKKY